MLIYRIHLENQRKSMNKLTFPEDTLVAIRTHYHLDVSPKCEIITGENVKQECFSVLHKLSFGLIKLTEKNQQSG